ncbi:MAG TPA: thioredoxin-dependent thiol peroxidase [Bryobacteraceae bacterium]|nr:thioredoxin-dependent thiol peroxidase [Bryobacteraceae bacterium]HPT27555.1 thioredoxin-dependent thiol peroxidase [Bryobacteraceae bacterium]
MAELKVGSKAPDFAVLTDAGQKLKLSSLKGHKVVLYFYPKADTPGCTKEACSFRDEMPRIEAANTVVLGISPDPVARVAKFKEKYSLPFTLLADEDHAVAERYGVWVEKKNYGKAYMGIERTTFVIGTDGGVASIFRKVKVDGHTEEVLAALAQVS